MKPDSPLFDLKKWFWLYAKTIQTDFLEEKFRTKKIVCLVRPLLGHPNEQANSVENRYKKTKEA